MSVRPEAVEALVSLEGEDFAQGLVERARRWAAEMIRAGRCEVVERPEAERRAGVLRWCQYRAWAEWWNAVPPAAKQLVLLADDDFDLKVRLGQQIIDEIKHQRVFSRHVHHLGGDARLGRFRPDGRYLSNSQANAREDAFDLAVVLQCTGEAVLNEYMRPGSVLYEVLDPETARVVREDVSREEPRHIAIGVDLLARYAATPELRRRAVALQTEKLARSYQRYLSDFDLLGIRRTLPESVV